MKLSEELQWRGFVNQTTYSDMSELDKQPISFYWGVDPSADSMTIGHLAAAMMVRHFIAHGHKAFLLVGGATGIIGDPDGKKQERDLQSPEELTRNIEGISAQYKSIFAGQDFEIVNNNDWFKDIKYLDFLRDIGKHMSMTQLLDREFVKSRTGEGGTGISYAEFSYSLIQGYDFLHLFRNKGVTLQVCGADQWGNSLAGVEMIRKLEGASAHVYSFPLVINKTTGVKFGKSEEGAVWLDPKKTTSTQFYQFWINIDDAVVEDYLKIFTTLDKDTVDETVSNHVRNPGDRYAQRILAHHVTALVHGQEKAGLAEEMTDILTSWGNLEVANQEAIDELRKEIPGLKVDRTSSIIDALVSTKLASSNSEARRLINSNAIAINGKKTTREHFEENDFKGGRLLLRRGKAFKDSAFIELGK